MIPEDQKNMTTHYALNKSASVKNKMVQHIVWWLLICNSVIQLLAAFPVSQ